MAQESAQTVSGSTPDAALPGAGRVDRFALGGRTLRQHAARGTMINAAFNVGLAALTVARRFLVAIFLTATEYGIWGLIFVAVTAILWFKEIGINDKYIQQDEPDQELAFQKAFTLNLIWTGLFCLVILAAVPVFSVIYGQPEIIAPGSLFSLAVLATAFQAPTWVFYRQMRYTAQRLLLSIEPVLGFIVTIVLGAAGAGYWSLVIGILAGTWAAALASVIWSPYPLRWRFDRAIVKDYYSFSWPLLLSAGSGFIVVQVSVIVGQATVGLVGVGAIGLAGTIAAFADRVDTIITQTLYPAVCAVKDRVDLLFEAFTKSNRLALIWGMPFGLGLALFAPDVVHYVLGDKWDVATGLLQVFGVMAGFKQIAFNWTAFHRAIGDTRPIAVNGVVSFVVFVALVIPGMILWGLTGYAIAICAMLAAQIVLRGYYLSRLFSGFRMLRHTVRAVAPSVPAVAVIGGLHLLESGPRTGSLVVAELCLYLVVTVVATWLLERSLLREMFGYFRAATRPAGA